MFHQVTRAILPDFSLGQTLLHWNQIADDLAESPRQRLLQIQKLAQIS
jgi:hypothetical protein